MPSIAAIQWTLSSLILIGLVFSVYYSMRFRRTADPQLRGLYSARMNISMGLMLIVIAITQLFFGTDSVPRRVFGVIAVLLGLFNLFAGLRNHGIFNRRP